jgi:hypothetical protein
VCRSGAVTGSHLSQYLPAADPESRERLSGIVRHRILGIPEASLESHRALGIADAPKPPRSRRPDAGFLA